MSFHFLFAAIILQFDGSLRNVSTPQEVASCASTLTAQNGDVIALGGKAISTFLPDRLSSGNAEYHGLLLALKWLTQATVSGRLDNMFASSNKISIEGDCKTIIDHMNGKSAPRKLRVQHRHAVSYIDNIKAYAREKLDIDLKVKYQHIPRRDNVLCDTLCSVVVGCIERGRALEVQKLILQAEQLTSDPSTAYDLPTSKKSRLRFRDTHFQRPLDAIGIISPNAQIAMFQILVRAASRDGVALRVIGEKLKSKKEQFSTKEIETVGTLLDVIGLRMLELHKEAEKAERKNLKVLKIMERGEGTPSFVVKALDSFCTGTPTTKGTTLAHGIFEDNKVGELLNEWCVKHSTDPTASEHSLLLLLENLYTNGAWIEKL